MERRPQEADLKNFQTDIKSDMFSIMPRVNLAHWDVGHSLTERKPTLIAPATYPNRIQLYNQSSA